MSKGEVPVKGETATKPEVRRRGDWFDWPDVLRWDFPEMTRWFERGWPGGEGRLRVEEEVQDDKLVIRAEIPGIDPEKDVEITVADGALHLKAERRKETREEAEGRVRTEFRYGSYSRTVALPKGTDEKDVSATYRDGILEVTVPYKAAAQEKRKIAISRS